MTVRAFKGKDGPCLDHNQAVIYQGPWKQVMDDDGHILRRGTRMAVCEKTFQIYGRAPYQDQIISVPAAHNRSRRRPRVRSTAIGAMSAIRGIPKGAIST